MMINKDQKLNEAIVIYYENVKKLYNLKIEEGKTFTKINRLQLKKLEADGISSYKKILKDYKTVKSMNNTINKHIEIITKNIANNNKLIKQMNKNEKVNKQRNTKDTK